MKIVIDIPDAVYDFTIQRGHLPYGVNIAGRIIDGQVVPGGHGRLIDGDALYESFMQENFIYEADSMIVPAPTIIAADKGVN